MKNDNRILLAFILNLFFSLFEFFGGIFTGSIAIFSDALHDFGDATSIGASYFLEKISHKKPDEKYTYGYYRYSLLGSAITTFILIIGSVTVFYNAVLKIFNPAPINYNGMIIFAVIGFIVNIAAAYFTHGENSLNAKAVNLHMLEDSLGWAAVLIGAIIMKFTNLWFLDPALSIALALFIFINAAKNLKTLLNIFLEKTPDNIDVTGLKNHLEKIKGVENIHHFHLRSLDGFTHEATLHIVTNGNAAEIKQHIKSELAEHGIIHSVVETETVGEKCEDTHCHIGEQKPLIHHHHHH